MIIALMVAGLLCAAIGSLFNYIGVELMRCAFENMGGVAISMFFGGLLLTMGSLLVLAMVAMVGNLLIKSIKRTFKRRINMPRYYEETALIEFVKQYTPTIEGETTLECVERAIRNAPTADVVPKSEVAREIVLEIDTLICCHANGDIDDKNLYMLFDELKKKYIGGE